MLPLSKRRYADTFPALLSVNLGFPLLSSQGRVASQFKNRSGKSATTLERFIESIHENIDLFLRDDKRR